ncbi:MAG: ComF family protein [Prevotellaceae bacterium]|jgi:ComF family protein|nr:ComF family protein [Prevotellaceae bacterium]
MLWAELIQNFTALLFPKHCEACGCALRGNEQVLCLSCIYHLPRTNYWKEPGNAIEQLFWGKVRLEHACAFFFFGKGSRYRHLLHHLKYNGKREIGVEMGRRLGMELKNAPLYQSVDVVIPVPLHPKKQRKRGYNQSEQIARGIAETTGWAVDSKSVIRNIFTATQTRKTRMERWENVAEVFSVAQAEALTGKHVLLVDDVITTGATIEACAQQLLQVQGCRVSVAALACVN